MMRFVPLVAALAVGACARSALLDDTPGDFDGDGDNDQGDGDSGPTDDDTAVVLLGQASGLVNANLEDGLELPSDLAICGGRLFVADQFHHRVLVWDSFPARGRPSLVLGQPTFTTRASNYAGVDARGLSFPDGIACNSDTLAVADTSNSRVLIWQPLPTTNFEAASVVVGQPDFSTSGGRGITATGMNGPRGVALVGSALFVADTAQNRVMVWNNVPTVNGVAASFALGQPNLTSGAANAGTSVNANGMFVPAAVASDGTRLFIADSGNNRVLVWNTVPGAAVPPSFVLGQANFITGTLPPSQTASSLETPDGFGFAGTNTVVFDSAGSRALVFNVPITANNQAANIVFGGSIHVGGLVPLYSATTLASPRALAVGGNEVYLADALAHRVLVYATSLFDPVASRAAIAVIGQPGLNSGSKRTPASGVNGLALGLPMDVVVNGEQVLVVDFIYHRVLGWNALSSAPGTPADFVLGQPDLVTYDPHEDQTDGESLLFPTAARVIGGNLHVIDRDHHRILVWDGVPTANVPPARALGQPTLDAIAPSAVVDGSTFRQPTNLDSDGTRFAVADTSYNRILLWNTIPTDANDAADVVLGQPSMDVVTSNTGGLSASSLRSSRDVCFTPNGIAVADTGNHRVLIWNSIPTTNAAPADVVLGQASMALAVAQPAGPTTTGNVLGLHYADGLFYVTTGNRVLVWRGVPATNNAPADYVLGQPSFTVNLANNGGIGIDTLNTPVNMVAVGEDMYIADTENNRIVRRRRPAP
ncbi:MAG: hypothetical protein ACAI38_10370 [Myxococcota bacterium]